LKSQGRFFGSRESGVLLALAVLLVPALAVADDAAVDAAETGAVEDAGPQAPACGETIPPGATRPTLMEKITPRSKAGDLLELEIAVRHGAGESATLPADLPGRISVGEVRIADDGTFGRGALPKATVDPGDPTHATTLLKIPFVVLSTSVIRKKFTIPALQVIVLRRGGGDLTVCTQPHEVEVDQPIASTPDPKVRQNPPSVPQITRNEALQQIVTWCAIALVSGAAFTLLALWLRSRRPKYVPPPPPPIPSWTIALREISVARDEFVDGKLDTKHYYDRLSDTIRQYLGRQHGFEGLDMTTDEILVRMRRVPSPLVPMDAIVEFMEECDLVKFASVRPGYEESIDWATKAERLVKSTSPMGGYYLTHEERRSRDEREEREAREAREARDEKEAP